MTKVTPLWRTVLDDLRDRVRRGEFEERFPTDRELMEMYDVSRHTVREAVRELQATGTVTRRPGRGSWVERGIFVQPLGTVYSLFESIEATGAQQDSVVLAQEVRLDPIAAEALDLHEETELFYLERVRLADGEPLAHDRVWMPAARVEPLAGVDFGHTALYLELRRHCGLVPASGREMIAPVVPDAAHAEYLDLDAGEPVLQITRRTEADGEPLEWRITMVRGDRYGFQAEWGPADGQVVPRMVAG